MPAPAPSICTWVASRMNPDQSKAVKDLAFGSCRDVLASRQGPNPIQSKAMKDLWCLEPLGVEIHQVVSRAARRGLKPLSIVENNEARSQTARQRTWRLAPAATSSRSVSRRSLSSCSRAWRSLVKSDSIQSYEGPVVSKKHYVWYKTTEYCREQRGAISKRYAVYLAFGACPRSRAA